MQFLPILEMTLGKHVSLPKRRINSVEEFFELFPEAKEVFLDGTERRVQKPRNLKITSQTLLGQEESDYSKKYRGQR
jgi:hypothetical protein